MNPIEQTTKGIRLEVGPELYNHLKSVQNQLRDIEDRKRSLSELILILIKRGMQVSNDMFGDEDFMYIMDVDDPGTEDLLMSVEEGVQNDSVQSDSSLNSPQNDFEAIQKADAETEIQLAMHRQIIKEKKEMVITGELYNPDFVQKDFPFPEFSELAFQNGQLLPASRIRLPFREARSLLNKPNGMSDYEWLTTPHIEWEGNGIDKYASLKNLQLSKEYRILFDWADNLLNECIRQFFKITRKETVKSHELTTLYFKVKNFVDDKMYKKMLPIQYPYRRAYEVLLLERLKRLIMLLEVQKKRRCLSPGEARNNRMNIYKFWSGWIRKETCLMIGYSG